jgi:PIN domain nuclease of toxin-antitoxin system
LRLLIDTHALVWWLTDNRRRLCAHAASAMADPGNELFVSACAAYEIRYKQSLRRLPPFPGDLQNALLRERIGVLSISLAHALAAASLPGPHRDPWDRMMIAQAQLEALTVVTVDQAFDEYGVPTLW